MRRNVASQHVGAQMITAADGTAFTGTVSVSVTGDSGTQGAGGGTAPAHEGNGYHSYTPTQAETNYTHVAFTFTGTGAIPVTVQVYPKSYDANGRADLGQISGSAVSTSTAQLGVNTVQAGGTAWGSGAITAASIATGAFTAAKFAAGAFDAVWTVTTRALTSVTNIVSGGAITTSGGAVSTVTNVTNLHASAATSANQTTILNRIGAFTGSGVNTILGFFQALLRSDAITLPTDIGGTFDNTTDSVQAIRDHIGDGTNLTEAGGTGDHLTAIDLPDQTMNITGNLSGSVGSVTGAVGSVTGNVGGNVTGSVGSLAAQAKADVNAEVVDALDTDTYTTPAQGAPPASASITTMLRNLYFPFRNRSAADGNYIYFYGDDESTVLYKKQISDNGTTYTEQEAVTGP